jgi:peptide/nickel transport system substrate-binding protein
MKSSSSLCTLLVCASLLAWAPAHAQKLAASQVIRAGLSVADIRTLDPHTAIATGEVPMVSEIYEALVAFKPGTMDVENLQPGLALSWEASADKKVWTFRLRPDVKWHDGNPFTAEDVKFSLERVQSKDFGSPFRASLENLVSIATPDPMTVVMTLAQPDTSFPQLMASYQAGYIVSKKATQAGDIKLAPVGTGPFKLTSYKSRESVTMERNDQYWGGKPVIQRIVYQFMTEASTRELALRSGELDMIAIQARQDIVSRVRRSGAEVDLTAPSNTFYLHLNATKKPLDDLRVRQALAYATDRANLIKFIGSEIAKPETSALPKGYVGHTDDVIQYAFDVSKAKALLTEAGMPNGFTLSVNMASADIYLPPMQVIQEQWKKIGVTLDIKVVDEPTYHRLIREDANPVVIYGAFRYPLTGRIYLHQFYNSVSAVGKPTASVNFSHLGDGMAGVDDELAKASYNADPAQQIALWQTAQKKIADAAVSIPLYTQFYAMAKSPLVDLGAPQKSLSFYRITEKSRLLERQ